MSKKKGLSLEEKRSRMMEIFFETKDVFQLKDIEKIAPKMKGIKRIFVSISNVKESAVMEIFIDSLANVPTCTHENIRAVLNLYQAPMSVKDVLQSLVDDNMVDCERVGTSNYYWAFPSKALHGSKRRLEELDKQLSEAKQRKVSLQQAVDKAKVGREDTDERDSLLKELKALKEDQARLQADLEKYRECDPDVIEEMRKSNMTAKEAVSRWTDNVFSIKSWAKRKFDFDDNRIDKAFGIPEDFDYMD